MARIVFTIEGEYSDLDWVRTRIDGAIQDVLGEAEEENRLDGKLDYGWEYDD